MGLGKTLTIAERAKMDVLRSMGKKYCEIAVEIGRSICAISNYLKNKENLEEMEQNEQLLKQKEEEFSVQLQILR